MGATSATSLLPVRDLLLLLLPPGVVSFALYFYYIYYFTVPQFVLPLLA